MHKARHTIICVKFWHASCTTNGHNCLVGLRHIEMNDCAPSCHTDATYIDMHQRMLRREDEQTDQCDTSTDRFKERERALQPIRRKFVCHKCHQYPGDEEWSLGCWDNGPYTCFDCTRRSHPFFFRLFGWWRVPKKTRRTIKEMDLSTSRTGQSSCCEPPCWWNVLMGLAHAAMVVLTLFVGKHDLRVPLYEARITVEVGYGNSTDGWIHVPGPEASGCT